MPPPDHFGAIFPFLPIFAHFCPLLPRVLFRCLCPFNAGPAHRFGPAHRRQSARARSSWRKRLSGAAFASFKPGRNRKSPGSWRISGTSTGSVGGTRRGVPIRALSRPPALSHRAKRLMGMTPGEAELAELDALPTRDPARERQLAETLLSRLEDMQ